MWLYLDSLFEFVSPTSLILNRMDEPLLSGEVWVAWDHTARLLDAVRKRPDEFVAFPAPVGPKGRGFLSVLAGLGLPRGSSGEDAASLMEYLTRPEVQVRTMEQLGFLPVVDVSGYEGLSAGSQMLIRAASEQLDSAEGIFSSIPVLTGDSARRFDLVYLNAFSQIVLRNRNPQEVLPAQEKVLAELGLPDPQARSETQGH